MVTEYSLISRLKKISLGLKNIFLPIKKSELRRFLPLSILLMFIIFIYQLMRATKDAALITSLGAEMISTVKLWGVLPSSIIFMLIYTKLANIIQREIIFYILGSVFLVFFISYPYLIYPNRLYLELDLTTLKDSFPIFKFPLLMLEKWTTTLLYIFAELWGSIMLSLLFWQFVNHITPFDQAKRFYSLFGIIGQIGMLIAGIINQNISSIINVFIKNYDDLWYESLKIIMLFVFIAGLILMFIYRWLNLELKASRNTDTVAIPNMKKKTKLSIIDSLKYVFTSSYIGAIGALVVCYGISIALVEAVWKNQLRLKFPIKNDYLAFMGQFQTVSAVVTILGMIIGTNIIRKLGWFAGAMVTPLMLTITGALFFIFILFQDSLDPILNHYGYTALYISILIGALQNMFTKAMKYSAFDATKEMAYIPIDEELKIKGKAAVDVVGARFGKSGGALIQQALFLFTGYGISMLAVEMMGIFFIVMILWFYGVLKLNKAFISKISK